MANPCGDALPPPYSSAETTNIGNGNKKKFSSEFDTEFGWRNGIEYGLDEELERLSRCCVGRFDSRSSLQLLALLNFLLDGLCTYLSLEHMFASYIFAGCSVISLLTLCAVINGIQEEKKSMIKVTAMYVGIKAVVLLTLTLTALAAFVEEHIINKHFRASLESKALFWLLSLFVVALSAQYRISQRVVRLIRLKDEIYVISGQPIGVGRGLSSKIRSIQNGKV